MEYIAIFSVVLHVSLAIAAAFGLVMLLRWLDQRAGYSFASAMGVIRAEPVALALYLGLRWLGACILVGWILS